MLVIVSHILIRWVWPNRKSRTLSEMRPFLVPVGWGCLIAVVLMLAGLWKPLEYIMTWIPAIALLVVFMRWRAKRKG